MPRKDTAPSPRLSFTLDEVGELTGLGQTSIFKALKEKRLPARKWGRRTIVLKADLDAFLRGLEEAR